MRIEIGDLGYSNPRTAAKSRAQIHEQNSGGILGQILSLKKPLLLVQARGATVELSILVIVAAASGPAAQWCWAE